MPIMFIPEIGSKIKLTKDWTFMLYAEYRNKRFFETLGPQEALKLKTKTVAQQYYGTEVDATGKLTQRADFTSKVYLTTISKNSILQVDRIYIRKGIEGFSSITFLLLDTSDPRFAKSDKMVPFSKSKQTSKARFWAKLEDVNAIEYKLEEDTVMSALEKDVEVRGQVCTYKQLKKELEKKNPRFWVEYTSGRLSGRSRQETLFDGITSANRDQVRFTLPHKKTLWGTWNWTEHPSPCSFRFSEEGLPVFPVGSEKVYKWTDDTLMEDMFIDGDYLSIYKVDIKRVKI